VPGGAARATGRLDATTDFARVGECDALILCVPTPLDEHFEPDLSFVTGTLDAVVPHMRPGQLISLESTTYPGTTEEEVVPRLERAGLKVGESVFVVYSPNARTPATRSSAPPTFPKVVGGITAACRQAAKPFTAPPSTTWCR